MKKGKVAGPSGGMLEMILVSQKHIAPNLKKFQNNIVAEGNITED